MSDGTRYDVAWVTSVARVRGVDLEPHAAARIATTVAPTLEAFHEIADSLAIDDDMYAFRQLLADEGRRD
jgi:hypothetical protein